MEDNVAARLNKMALVSYRIAGLCGLVEVAFNLACAYISYYTTFGDGQADEAFFHRAEKIVDMKYGPIIRKEQNFVIHSEICYRAQNVVAQNLAQYMILMKLTADDRKNWNGSWGRNIRPVMKPLTTNEDVELAESMNVFKNLSDTSNETNLPLTKKQEKMLKKTNEYKKYILLHNSLIFHKSCLYVVNFLKKASLILEAKFLQPLVNDRYLLAIANGLICSKSKATIYIKIIPTNDNDSKDKLIKLLADIHHEDLNYNTYMASCKSAWLATRGVLSQEVIEALQQEHYQRLNIDFTSLFQHNQSGNRNGSNSKIFYTDV